MLWEQRVANSLVTEVHPESTLRVRDKDGDGGCVLFFGGRWGQDVQRRGICGSSVSRGITQADG